MLKLGAQILCPPAFDALLADLFAQVARQLMAPFVGEAAGTEGAVGGAGAGDGEESAAAAGWYARFSAVTLVAWVEG